MTDRKAFIVGKTGAACGFAAFLFVSTGCASKKAAPQPTAQERQDRALKDPFGYKPNWNNTNVSGGGTADLDQDGLRKDLNNVFIR